MKYLLAAILLKLMELTMPADPDKFFKTCTSEVHQEKADLLQVARVRSTRRRIMSDAWYGVRSCSARREVLIKKASRYYR